MAEAADGATLAPAVGAALAALFATFDGLVRAEWRLDPGDARGLAVAEQAGFVREGYLRSADRGADGQIADRVLLARIRPA
jgi:RimJ/RimL family protein N-acetyltransferase